MGGLGKENTSMPFGSSRALRRSVRFWICVLIYWILFWLLFSKRHAGFSLCSLSTPSFNHGPLGSADSFSCLSCLIYESRANKCIPARASSPVWEAKVVVPIFWIHIVWIDACPQSSTFTPRPNPCSPAWRPGNRCNYRRPTKTLFRFHKHGVYVLEL